MIICTDIIKSCVICAKEFRKTPTYSVKEWNKRQTCSRVCGYKLSSQKKKGKKPANFIDFCGSNRKGTGRWYDCKGCSKKFQSPDYATKYCSKECSINNKPVEFKPRVYCGEKHWNWKGGINKENSRIRNSLEYKQWRYEVLKRDNHTCVNCGSTEKIRADHIKPFHLYPELRHDINNGRALCKECDVRIGYCFFKENNPRKRIPGVEIT